MTGLILNLTFFLVLAWLGTSGADDKKVTADTFHTRPKQLDIAPKTIDVSEYPKEMQEKYKIFEKACTKCHSLARPISSDLVLPDEWKKFIKKKKRRPGSGISSKNAKAIYQFLVYDSQIRKKGLYERKLKEQEALEKDREKQDKDK